MPNSITITVEESIETFEDIVVINDKQFKEWVKDITVSTNINNIEIDCSPIYVHNIIDICVEYHQILVENVSVKEMNAKVMHRHFTILKIYDIVNKFDDNEIYRDKRISKLYLDKMHEYFDNLDNNITTLTFDLSGLCCNILFNGELIDEDVLVNRILNNPNIVFIYKLKGNLAKEPYLTQVNTTINRLVEKDKRLMSTGDTLFREHNNLSDTIFYLVEKRRIGLGHQYSEGLDDYAKQCYDWETK